MLGDDWSSGVEKLLELEDLNTTLSVSHCVEGVDSSLDVITVDNVVVSNVLLIVDGVIN